MSLEKRGFVGLFCEPLNKEAVEELVLLWLEKYGFVEQTMGNGTQVLTQKVKALVDLGWDKNLQFRILSGEQFAWIYLTLDRHVIETTGLAQENGDLLCRDVLENLPGCGEIIDERNDRRLDELEAKGIM